MCVSRKSEVERLEALLDAQLGPHMRRVVYYHLLQSQNYVQFFFEHGRIPSWQAWCATRFFPLFKFLISKGLGVHRAGYEISLSKVARVYDELDKLLEDGRQYLANTSAPSAADLSLAALSILIPDNMPSCSGYPPMEEKYIGPNLTELLKQFRARPAGAVRSELLHTTLLSRSDGLAENIVGIKSV